MGFESKGRSGVSNVSHTTLQGKTPAASGSTVAERARAKRAADPVCIEMPVRVRGIGGLPIAGTSDMGQDFSEDTRTLIVMATGAVVRMATRVKKGQLLGLKHLSTGQEVSCRVVNVNSRSAPWGSGASISRTIRRIRRRPTRRLLPAKSKPNG